MIDANTVASDIVKCTSRHGTFCQQYCLYLLCDKDKDYFLYTMKIAQKRGFTMGELIPTSGILSASWHTAVGTFIDNVIELLHVKDFNRNDVINRIRFQTWQS